MEQMKTELLVIGGGAAGLAAAAAAAEQGAKVIVTEAMAAVGGNGLFPRGVFAVDSVLQRKRLIFADTDEIFTRCMEYSHWKIDGRIVRRLLDKSGDTISWLMDKGVAFCDVVHHTPNQAPEVFHITSAEENAGSVVVRCLKQFCLEHGVTLLTKTKGKTLVKDESGAVIGAICEQKDGGQLEIRAERVIVCTGGFSVRNLSIASYGLPACEVIITVFMLLCSLNFAVFFLVLTGRLRQALGSDELRFFLLAVALSSAIVFFNVLPLYESAGHALRDTLFQVSSVVSTTGFSTADFALWPTVSQFVLVLLMFLGGCAGSTAGGLKASRVLLLLRCARRSLRRLSHPRAVKVVKLDGKAVDEETLNTVFVFFTCFFLVLGGTCLVVSLDGFSLTTSCSAALACISNTGPGLEAVGPLGNFAAFSSLSKVVLSMAMLVGRLEIFPILILFQPSTWGRN